MPEGAWAQAQGISQQASCMLLPCSCHLHAAVSMHDDGRWPPLHIPSWRAAPALASPRLRRPASWRCTAGTTLSCWRCWRRRRTAAGQVAGPLGTAPLTATRTRATTRTAPAAGAASSAGARGAMPGLQTSGLGESGACGPDEATCQPAARACACWSCCCRDSVSLLAHRDKGSSPEATPPPKLRLHPGWSTRRC